MSNEMMFGIAKMPYEMAMGDEMSRRQFYANTQRLAAALEAAREDAERYRWLRNHYGLGALHRADHHLIITRCGAYSGAAEGLDRSIDAAIAAEKKEGE